jgi:hypothetical protein
MMGGTVRSVREGVLALLDAIDGPMLVHRQVEEGDDLSEPTR